MAQLGEPLGLLLSITASGAAAPGLAGTPVGLLLAITTAMIGSGGADFTYSVETRENLEVDDD